MRRGQKSSDRKAAVLCRELTKWWPALWTFAWVEGVEPTNNRAERALRPAVLWRKGSFGSDSAAGSRFPPKIRTSGDLQGHLVAEALKAPDGPADHRLALALVK